MPVIFQDRCSISLYDAQHSSGVTGPIPSRVIEEIVTVLQRFMRTCRDFGVADGNIRVVATEATRNAINRDVLLQQIKDKTGWTVQLLSKEEEGRLGALGIASSVDHLDGICMDMGGGSVQLTWMKKKPDGDVDMGPSVSFPYGAAAVMSRLAKATGAEENELRREIASRVQNALEKDLQIPASELELVKQRGGFSLYLSGGGFRGWGHILMSREKVQPYPIPIINGYGILGSQFYSALDFDLRDSPIFRISSRRASQIPAIQVLIEAIEEAQLPVTQVMFAQGGVREGLLFSDLPLPIRSQNPLVTSTVPYAPRSAAKLSRLLRDALPCRMESEILEATVNLLYVHGFLHKDIRAGAALRCTTSGLLAGVHGLSHRDRWLIGLILCERWGGDVSDVDAPFADGLRELCGPLRWWTRFIGRMAKGIANLFPAGRVPDGEQSVRIQAGLPTGQDSHQANRCWVNISVFDNDISDVIRVWINDIKKLGKGKHWATGEIGLKVDVKVKGQGNSISDCKSGSDNGEQEVG